MVFFLASLPEDEYVIVKEIFDLFEQCDIKDQKLSRSKRGSLVNSKLDCKGVNFKPLRGLAPKIRKDLLQKVCDGEMSFSELGSSCKYIKQMTEVKTNFMRYLDISESWEQAEEKYPEHTKKEKLEPFLEMSFKNNVMPPTFIAFCKQAKCCSLTSTQAGPSTDNSYSSNGNNVLQAGTSSLLLLKHDVLQMEDNLLMTSTSTHSCNGFSLTIVDPPKVGMHPLPTSNSS